MYSSEQKHISAGPHTYALNGGNNLYFHQKVFSGQMTLNAVSHTLAILVNPGVPHPVHGSEIPLDILQPNSGLQDVALVCANICQQLLNLGGCNIIIFKSFVYQSLSLSFVALVRANIGQQLFNLGGLQDCHL